MSMAPQRDRAESEREEAPLLIAQLTALTPTPFKTMVDPTWIPPLSASNSENSRLNEPSAGAPDSASTP